MKMLNAEEKTAYYYWFVLNKIKEGVIQRGKSETPISYIVHLHPALNDPYIPNSLEERFYIKNLKDLGAIKECEEPVDFQIGGDEFSNPDAAGINYSIEIINPVFDRLFNKYKRIISKYQLAEKEGNTLTFNVNGEIQFVSPDGNVYTARLNTNTNPYLVLKVLVEEPNKVIEFRKFDGVLNEPRGHADSPAIDRRVRDSISSLKEKLNYSGEDLFISDNGFGLKCKVHIIK